MLSSYLIDHHDMMTHVDHLLCHVCSCSSTNMKWHCHGDANDHHSVVQCAPDKIPQLAPNQVCA